MWMSWNHKLLFSLVARSGNFLSYCVDVVPPWVFKNVWNDFGRFLFMWSYTNFRLLRSTIHFNLKIFDFFYRGTLDSHGHLRLIIWSALFWIFSMFLITWVWACPHSWQPYRRWDLKIAEYIVFKSFESTWYLILAERLFSMLSLSSIASMCCSNVRCWSNFRPNYLASVAIFIFCPVILKFICFFTSTFFVLKRIISVLLVLSEILFAPSKWIMFLFFYLFVDVSEGLAWVEQICIISKMMNVRVIGSIV